MEIVYEPWRRLVIHEIIQYGLDDFLRLRAQATAQGQLALPLSWADGVLFDQIMMPQTEAVVKEQLEGRIHWALVSFTYMEKFEPYRVVKEGNIRVPIIDVSGSGIAKVLVKWIKANYKP
jgi:hypothetical protein